MNYDSKKKSIFISFHWRINHRHSISGTQYLDDINHLLNSDKLRKMANDGVEVYFLPHSAYLGKLGDFRIPPYVNVPSDMPF